MDGDLQAPERPAVGGRPAQPIPRSEQAIGGGSLRPRRVHAVLFVAATVVALAAGYVANYQPFRHGGSGSGSPCFKDRGWFSSVHGEDVQGWDYICSAKGEEVTWATSMTNDGSFPVEVVRFARDGEPWFPLGEIEVSVAPINGGQGYSETQPFEPFTIHPGETYVVRFSGVTQQRCDDRSGWTTAMAGTGMWFKLGPITRYARVDNMPSIRMFCAYDG